MGRGEEWAGHKLLPRKSPSFPFLMSPSSLSFHGTQPDPLEAWGLLLFPKCFFVGVVPYHEFLMNQWGSRQYPCLTPLPSSCQFLPMLFSKNFIVFGLKVRSLIHFEFIFVYSVRQCSNFILLHTAIQFFQQHLLIRLFFPDYVFLAPLSKIRYPQVCGLISRLSILLHWFIFLFQCLYHAVLMTIALQCSLKSGRLIPPAPCFFLKFVLDIQGLFCFQKSFFFFFFFFVL